MCCDLVRDQRSGKSYSYGPIMTTIVKKEYFDDEVGASWVCRVVPGSWLLERTLIDTFVAVIFGIRASYDSICHCCVGMTLTN